MTLDRTEARGTHQFEVTKGRLRNTAANVQTLRRLWLDRSQITADALGPGDPGDFDHGAWHVSCHLVAAGGVCRRPDGTLLWLEVSHDANRDRYFASVSLPTRERLPLFPLDSAEGRELMKDAEVLGFVEGNSTGRTSVRNAADSPTAFNLWRRQDFDQPIGSEADGGKVWEHWCTLRDIREGSELATSVLTAYVSLMAVLGDRFVAMVARGRSDYAHPKQLCAMIEAGVASEEAATSEITPFAIPDSLESEFAAAEPRRAAQACAALDWSNPPRYYIFKRRIERWADANFIKQELSQSRSDIR